MEELQLYDITNLPARLRKELELKRWRDIMTKQRYEQDYLDGFLDAEAQARESDIDSETFLRRKQALAARWFKYYKMARDNKRKEDLVRQYNMVATMTQRG